MEKDRKMMMFCLLLAAISSPVFTGEWNASVVKNLDALVTSCIVIPCSYTHAIDGLSHSRLRGIWHLSTGRDQRIYHEDKTMILENFRGRTKLLGNLGQGNCALEMIEIKDHDNGPFCFRVEIVTGTSEHLKLKCFLAFSFFDSCVNFTMITEPPKPTLIPPKTAIQGHPYTITCSVIHTCPSHIPQLTWSRGTAEEILEVHREIHQGTWESQSNLTFITEEKDNHTDITCTAEFFGGRTSTEKLTLHVKHEIENHNHIIIPVVVGISTTVIFGGLCFFILWKKYK
ncbi:myelin-associated glycoprotein-like [Scomber japonicus]|uniref:myelin-associated glycoprotein-like n=1 Tax=Scomber japonicus TaxID=13676 RepID=UPI0023057C77|nr:myelin-associated glycoprotein-like [Scomber japonicus]